MQYFFYDTCSLLNELHNAFNKEEKFYISAITLKELEGIKTSASKDAETKFRARRLIHLLSENPNAYCICNFDNSWLEEIQSTPILSNDNDSKIIFTALKASENITELVFVTQDLCCQQIAKSLGLNVQYRSDKDDNSYCGFKEIIFKNDDELAEIYAKVWGEDNTYDLLINEYLFIKDNHGKVIDKYVRNKNGQIERVDYKVFESKMFGKIKPKDDYQLAAMDSFTRNQITMVRGAAGTGKSYLSFGYLFNQLESGKIDKIIIFCNTVATSGSAKLGYYPGSRDEKLLDSQIGNLLISKLGDKFIVEKMIDDGTIILLPMSDIRGYDTTGMRAGIYISEAQNLDIELMRLALQRIGEDSICILDGDSDTQVDLSIYAGNNNGMRRVSEIFKGHDIYGEVTLQKIYRSKIAELAQLM